MQPQSIGTVTIEYNQTGQLISSLFEPTLKVEIDESLIAELKSVENSDNIEVIEHNASLILASWFNKVNHIELRDAEKTEIAGHVDLCEKHPDGRVKKCVVSYVFKDR